MLTIRDSAGKSYTVSDARPMPTAPSTSKATAGTDLSGNATTTSGGFNIPASSTRRPGDVQGQNVSTSVIGFNEFNGTAAIGSPGTYTVQPGGTFSITTTNRVNFIAATGPAAVTITLRT